MNTARLLSIRADQQQQRLAYAGDASVHGIQITKQAASGLYPVHAPTWSAQHFNVGVQRQNYRRVEST